MTSEQDIQQRVTAAKAEYDAWEANVVELLSDASKQIETPVFAGYMTALSGKSAFYIAALETALAVVSSERDAAVAAVEWEDLSYMSVASLADGLIQLSVEPGQHGGYSASVQGATRITRHGYTKLEGAKQAALELAMERMTQAARQHDAAEGSGGA